MSNSIEYEASGVEVAIVGMAGRFPGANDIDALWRNIRDGVESVTAFADQALRERGVSESDLTDAEYVKAGIVLEGIDQFDAGFFGYSPRDAEQLDPQHRIFLETAWHALEHAGHAGDDRTKLVGVYAGSGANVYLLRHLLAGVDWRSSDIASLLGLMNGNDKDSLATRVAYKLDLRGPAVSVQTACSTSLVAVHLACRSLLNHETDMALAGGVWLNLLQDGGYHYQPGAILSPDGHCRAFDARAAGTVIGSGAGIVVLKRLSDALAEGDTIHAVIKGSALNNDGAAKVGYTAPSVDGQAEVILAAQAMAEVSSDSIGYVEAHGTGTTLGDPIEIAALTQAFRAGSSRRGYCAIGSVKTNVGHLDAAAGVTGLIKTVLALKHQTLPPSLNFEQPNPAIDFANSPFYVNTEVRRWPAGETPRRAGVSAFGMGGTNVHVILEEAPSMSEGITPQVNDAELLLLSARSQGALTRSIEQLAQHLGQHPEQNLPDVAHTLRWGRKRFGYRAAVLARNHAEAIGALTSRAGASFVSGHVLSECPTVAFLFPGQGAQHVDMARSLYEREHVFRDMVDRCCVRLASPLALDLRELIYPKEVSGENEATLRLAQTAITQPALFVIEYAMAQLWMSWGLKPDAMLGHSIGEYVAACLAGVFSLEDALELVAARGRLIQSTPSGAMLAVSLPEAELRLLAVGCDVAAVNAPELGVLSGPVEVIDAVERQLVERGVAARRLHVSHAFHSHMLDPVLRDFRAIVSRIVLSPPRIPFVSNLTGRWITSEEACSADYWVQHLRGTVRFSDGLGELLSKPDRMLLEVGPGDGLSGLARRHPLAGARRAVLASQCHPRESASSVQQPLRCLAQLWAHGVVIDAGMASDHGTLRRVPLPGYPFEHQSYWVAPPKLERGRAAVEELPGIHRDWRDWFYVPAWRRGGLVLPPSSVDHHDGVMLLLGDEVGLSRCLHQRLSDIGFLVIRVLKGKQFRQLDSHLYELNPGERTDFEKLFRAVEARMGAVTHICHLWCLDVPGVSKLSEVVEDGFHALMALAQAMDAINPPVGERRVAITVLANQVEDITGMEPLCPEKATLHGPCKVIPQEFPGVSCRLVDVVLPADGTGEGRLAQQIVAEMCAIGTGDVVAYRGAFRWTKVFEPVRLESQGVQRIRRQGVYLITGGLGGIGLTLARHLAQRWRARLVLIGRTALPPRDAWQALVAIGSQDDALSAQVRSLLELESLGSEVLVLQADVEDTAQMRSAIEAARLRFGSIDGAIHAAGIAGGGMMSSRTREAASRVINPKLVGARNLMEALGSEPLSFVMLCSSLTAVVGGFGQIDYCAANCFLDAFAASESQLRGHVISVNWDAWREVGMASGQRLPEDRGIAPAQGGELLEALLNELSVAQVVVSTAALERQFAEVNSTGLADRLLPESVAKAHRYPRPQLPTPYAEATSEFESDLVALWGDFLGIGSIGIHDDFFELGGDSLLAIQLLARVRRDYGVDVHPAALFKNPSVAALAVLVESRLIEEIEGLDSSVATTDSAAVFS
ncbi:polyketide synthase [Diaphorobacter nitroreducens]|uniref:type I polyketide synthase n=1 Tax=Diaphorobacter nitroreducens TaxID=164759 RepID=UPI000B59C17B|nr:type I polyketide synthase [Diaphorobacter nitroreducens]ASI68651.1 polyketide synthase [Diaphorobacter nitroreducens]